jgi:peptidoglycan/LPS O-acetylase OafA/YrhL
MTMIVVLSELTYTLLERPLRTRGMALSREMIERQQAERERQKAGRLNLIE